MLLEDLRQALARDLIEKLDARVVTDHHLEHRANGLPQGRGIGVAADEGEAQAIVADARNSAGEIEHPLAPLEAPDVEQPGDAVFGPRLGAGRIEIGCDHKRMSHPDRIGDPIGTEVTLIGTEHVTPGPDEVVAVGERVALDLVRQPGLEVLGQMAVEDARELTGRVCAHAKRRPRQPRIAAASRLSGDEALPEVIGALEQVGPAAGIGLTDSFERPGAPQRQRAFGLADLPCSRLGDEADLDAGGQGIVRRPRRLVGPAVPGGREDRHLGHRRQHLRRRGHIGADPATTEGRHLPRDEGDARARAHRPRNLVRTAA